MRRVDLIAPPMAGHLHPILGLGRGLAQAFDVRVISTDAARPAIAAADLRGVTLLHGRDAEIQAIVEPAHPVGSHPWRLHRQLSANLHLLGAFHEALADLWRTGGPPALVLADFTLPVVGAVARRFDVPWWTSHPSPCVIETPDGPPGYLGGWSPMSGVAGRVRDALGRSAVRTAKQVAHRLHRAAMRRIGVESMYRRDGTEVVYSPDRVFALGLAAIEFPRRWPASVRLVGPVLYTPPTAVAAPPFVAGKRHVLVTIGTHLPWMKDTMAAAALAAARTRPDLEFHFSDGRDPGSHGASGAARPVAAAPNFHRVPYVSYGRDLARYALVAHHGGTGVMYRTLAAGLPAVVAPLDYDQFDHAARLVAAGVARRLDAPAQLGAAVAAALDDTGMARRCQALAAAVHDTDAAAAVLAEARARLGAAYTTRHDDS